ncbi:MAG: holin [Aerococcus urinaeequi]
MWNTELWTNMLLLATSISVVSTGLVGGIKKMFPIPVNFIPVLSVFVGMGAALILSPFITSDTPLMIKLWAGAISGFAGTGVFETFFKNREKNKED